MNFSRRSLLSAGAAFAATPAAAEIVSNGADQTVELQAAIDQAAANGGFLRLGAGKFLVTGLSLKTSLQIEGVARTYPPSWHLAVWTFPMSRGRSVLNIPGVTFEGCRKWFGAQELRRAHYGQ